MDANIQLQAVVRLAKQGDVRAFEDIYNLTCKYAYFHARSILKDEDEAWDLVQETYIAVYQNIGILRNDQSVKSWIGGIVFNLGHKRLRKNVDLVVNEDQGFLFENMADEDRDLSPEDALDAKETIEIVREVIDHLPVFQKAAVIAYYFDEKSIAAIAREAMCSEGTIKSCLNYARKALKESIMEREKEMGVSLHSVSGPIIILALHKLFVQMQLSAPKAQAAWISVEKGIGAAKVVTIEATAVSGTKPIKKIVRLLFGTVKKKVISASVLLAITAGGTMVGVTAAAGNSNRNQEEAIAEVEAERESSPEKLPQTSEAETGEAETSEAETTKAEMTVAATTESQPISGWIETAQGRKYREEDRTYAKHAWKEIDGELYYLKKNGMMATGDIYLGKQIFTFNESGIIEKITQINDATYYDEDIRYSNEDGLLISKLDGFKEKICDVQGVQKIAADDRCIYFMSEQILYKVNTDGSNLRSFTSSREWWTAIDITVKDGDAYFCYTDENEGDGDPPHGSLEAIISDSFAEMNIWVEGLPRYGQLQVTDDWIYFLHTNFNVPHYGGIEHQDSLFRATLSGDVIERITSDGIESYFVHGDILYYMQGGSLKKVFIPNIKGGRRE